MVGEREYYVEMWRLRRRLDYIDKLRPGANTSVFSIFIRPSDQITKIRAMLNEEYAKSSNIKSNQNRASVQEGLKAISEHLKAYRFIPKNGLACYYGSVVADPNLDKDLRLKLYFEPPRAIPRFMYNCDTSFDTSILRTLLQDDTAFGFIVVDGKGALFATVRGNTKEIHLKMSVDLPRKHTRGGQSAARFARIREDARKTYISQLCEKATEVFISDNVPNVSNIVLAGQAQLKDYLEKSSHFDPRLKPIICLTLTVDYGGEVGLSEAVKLSSAEIHNIRLGQEINYINTFMEHLTRGSEDFVAYGIGNVMQALEEGAVETIIAWQDLSLVRQIVKNADSTTTTTYLPAGEITKNSSLQITESAPLIEWLADNITNYGSKLELVSDQSTEGTMLVQGFEGLVAILRYSRVQSDDLTSECSQDTDSSDLLDGVY
uniref:Eukaryotic peptide chain release factor subunit 1 n=1 Tax=Hirondellea gigas TaxID=1518452 RepID=A0A2P2HWD7_9CRUS